MHSTHSHTQAETNARHGTVFTAPGPFRLESGAVLSRLDIAYTTHGQLNSEGTNAVLVCHALTGNAHAADAALSNGETIPGWFSGVIGPHRGLDTRRHCVITSNILGSCYGTTGPTSINPSTSTPYRTSFPAITVRDMVRAQKLLLDHLGVRRLVTVIGGSLGGMQALEWAILFPEMVESIIPIATSARHSAWCIGISETQRLAIMNDPTWQEGNYTEQPAHGLAIARGIAMIWYRSRASFEDRFGRSTPSVGDGHERIQLFARSQLDWKVESYLRYQGQKLVDRFDANTYITLTRAMDAHDIGSGRGPVKDVLGDITARLLAIGISSDVLYPVEEQKALASLTPRGEYAELSSPQGHDAFLIEFEWMNEVLRRFLPQ
ncbi:MAG: homoserine O-acetyltransferase [Bacteroidota bacterium]